MKTIKLLLLLTIAIITSCSDNTDIILEHSENTATNPKPEEQETASETSENPNPVGAIAGTTASFNKELISDNYILVNDAGNNVVYLMDKNANVLHEWNLNGNDIGNDCLLLSNGQMLAMLQADDATILFGGFGGKINLLKNDGSVDWSFVYSSDNHIAHHDAEMLPNGNILIMTWERRNATEAIANGYSLNIPLFPDALIEVNPTTDEIVWEWHVWDHLIQDYDDTKANFGAINENPQLININYNQKENGDITHANGIAYDPIKDVIYLSANFYSEVWVIDHSTTKEEAASHSGGDYQKGGDLIYRFGNPSAYNNPIGERLFYNNHHPNLLNGDDIGKMLIFSNGADLEQSTVYELNIQETFELLANTNNEPEITWSFTDEELFSGKVSGAVKLNNGNILITEGDFGIWEVTKDKEVVWKFSGDGFYWRAYSYNKTDPEIISLNLD